MAIIEMVQTIKHIEVVYLYSDLIFSIRPNLKISGCKLVFLWQNIECTESFI